MNMQGKAYRLLDTAVSNQDGGPVMLRWCEQWIDAEVGETEAERDQHGAVSDAIRAYRENRRS